MTQRSLVQDLKRLDPAGDVPAIISNAETGYYSKVPSSDLVADLKACARETEIANLSESDASEQRDAGLDFAHNERRAVAQMVKWAEAGDYEDEQVELAKPKAAPVEPEPPTVPAASAEPVSPGVP